MIFVTGASGHTASRLVRPLLDEGQAVGVLTRDPARLPGSLAERCRVTVADIGEVDKVAAGMAGARAVVAMTHIKFAPQVIAAAEKAGIRRAVFMSSTRRFTRFPEETARQVIDGEEAVRASALDWTILRASMIYGGPEDNNLTHLVRSLRRWPVHPLPAGGRMKWQPVFTWDVIAAIRASLERLQSIRKEYNIAGPEPISYREMVGTILRQLGIRRLLVPVPLGVLMPVAHGLGKVMKRPTMQADQIRRLQEDKTCDISAAVTDLGFEPVSFEEGIRRKIAGTA